MALAVKPRDYSKKVNRKERRLAMAAAFAARVEAGDVLVLPSISFAKPRTKDAVSLLADAGVTAARVLVILPEYHEATWKSFRNLRSGTDMKVEVRTAPASIERGKEGPKTQAFSTRDLLLAHKIVVAQDAMKAIEEVWA
jgi:large subunit ribosomal protein L4